MKKTLYFIYFILPFLIWFLIYLKNPDFIVIFKRPIYEESLIVPINDLWQIILIFFTFQLGNEILSILLKKHKFFGKINLIFIFFHILVVFYLFMFNFF